MDFWTLASSGRIIELTEAIYNSYWKSDDKERTPNYEYDLKEFEMPTDHSFDDMYDQIALIYSELNSFDYELQSKAAILHSESVNLYKLQLVEDFLNYQHEFCDVVGDHDLSSTKWYPTLSDYCAEKGIFLSIEDVECIWSQLFES